MSVNFPGSLDNDTSLIAATAGSTPVSASSHNVLKDAIVAVETKLGTGSATPVANKVLKGTGAGTSTWDNIVEADLSLSDVTTGNVGTAKHGFAPKLPNDATKYLDGTGAYTVPAGGGGSNPASSYSVKVRKSANQSISNSTSTSLSWDTEDYDNGGFHDNVTNNSRLTIPTGGDGYYDIQAGVMWAQNSTGGRHIDILLNGSSVVQGDTHNSANYNDECNNVAVLGVHLVAGDYIELRAKQSSGGSLNVVADNARTSFTLIKRW